MNTQSKPRITRESLAKRMHPLHSINRPFLLKYAPKYCKKLDMPIIIHISGLIASKVKKIKNLEHLSFSKFYYPSKYLIFQLLKDKRRQIKILPRAADVLLKYFPNISSYSLDISLKRPPREFLLLKHIKSLTLLTKKHWEWKCSWRFWKHLASLNSLKNLKILLPGFHKSLQKFMKKLNLQYSHLLASLDSLTLQVEFNKWPQMTYIERTFPNIFKNVTNLKATYDLFYFQNSFLSTVGFSTNIKHLILHVSTPETHFLQFSNFQLLQCLHRLEVLDLKLSLDTETCLRNFLKNMTFPASLKVIELEMNNVNWNILTPMISDQGYLLEDSLCEEFYSKWSHLNSLEMLTFNFPLVIESSASSSYFILPILMRLSSLTQFHYFSHYSPSEIKRKPLDFGLFLQAIAHSSSTIRVVTINDFEISLENLSTRNIPSFSLETLEMRGSISGESNIGILAGFFPKGNPKVHSDYHLELKKVIIKNNQTFTEFLKSLKRYAKLKVDLKIMVDAQSLDLDPMYVSLINFVSKGKRIPNLSLSILQRNETKGKEHELISLLRDYQTFRSFSLTIMKNSSFNVYLWFSDERTRNGIGNKNGNVQIEETEMSDENFTRSYGVERNEEGIFEEEEEEDLDILPRDGLARIDIDF